MHLPVLQTDTGMSALLELDQPLAIAQGFGLDLTLSSNEEFLYSVVKELLKTLSESSTGIVADPEYAFPEYLNAKSKTPLILRLEEMAAEIDPLAVPKFISNWGVEQIANNYALAKITLYYNPQEANALTKKQFLAEVFDYCQQQKIELVLKLIVFEIDGAADQAQPFADLQLQAVQELRGFAHALALQLPPDPLSGATITTELDMPWLLDMSGMDYTMAKDALRQSLESGAKGYLVGSTLWQEIFSLRQADTSPDLKAIKNFITTEAKDRAIELRRILDEFKVT